MALIKASVTKFPESQNEERYALLNLQLGEVVYMTQPDSARVYWERSLKVCEKLLQNTKGSKNIKSIYANSCNNIGYIAKMQGNIPKALTCFVNAEKIFLEIGDKKTAAHSLANAGSVYISQGDTIKALEVYLLSAKTLEELNDHEALPTVYNQIAGIYQDKRNKPLAIEYYEKAMSKISATSRSEKANTLNNLGDLFCSSGNYEQALSYFIESRKIAEEIGDISAEAISLGNIGRMNLILSKGKKNSYYQAALQCAEKSLSTGLKLGYPDIIKNSSKLLYDIYKQAGNYNSALEHYENYIKMRDSINNDLTRKASLRQVLKHEYEKQAAADSVSHAKESEIKNAELSKQKAEISAKKNQQYALFGGLALVIIFAGFMYNRFKVTQKQKTIIETQKSEVEDQKLLVELKQKEILDSIHYAKRIQLAQIPNEKQVEKIFLRLKSKPSAIQ